MLQCYSVTVLQCYSHAKTELHKMKYKFNKLFHALKHYICKTIVNRKFISVLNIDPVWK